MSLQTRLEALAAAVGADIKQLKATGTTFVIDGGASPSEAQSGVVVSNGGGSVIAAALLSTNYVATVAFAAIPNWQIVVPANSGAVEVGVAEGLLFNIVTGTNAAGTKFTFQARITDELGAVIGYNQKALYSSAAVAQTWTDMMSLKKVIGNNPAAKTYKVEVAMDKVGSAGSTSGVFTSASGFTDPTLQAVLR